MYQKKNIRVYIAWMLWSCTFIPLFVVKTFHYHGSEDGVRVITNHLMFGDSSIPLSSLYRTSQPIEFIAH